MKVLVSDNLGEIGVQMFQEADGISVDVNTGLPPEELIKIIGQYDALVIRSATKVTEALLDSAANLKVVGRAGIGLDNVDIPEATKRGVVVMNTPGGNTITTAEHAVSMMLSLSRNIPQGTMTMKEGQWEKKKLQGRELFNKNMGVVGYGKIGSIFADRARGLRMQVLVYDPFVSAEKIEKDGFVPVTLDELFARADYISVHVPLMKATRNLINKDTLSKMKDGVMLVNCARGGIINENDLYDAIQSGKVAGAAIDVFETEPPGKTPLIGLPQVICTPHLGASTKEAQTNVAVAVADQIIEYLTNGTIINAVNVPSVTGELLQKLRPFLTLADRMGCLQAQLVCGPLKEVIIEYAGEFHGMDVSPMKTEILKGLLTPLVKDAVNSVNAPVLANDMGIKVTETKQQESEDYNHLITVTVITEEMTCTVAGTIFGKEDPRVVKINNFRVEIVPKGHLALIHNLDKPGAIGSIGVTLGENDINIEKMHVGQEEEGERNIIFLRTNVAIDDTVLEKLRALPMVKTVIPLEL